MNRQNTQQLMTYDDEGNLKDAYVYGNNDERLTRDHIQNDNPTESGHRALDTYLYDGRGSVTQVTNEQSNIVGNQQYRYDPFGNMIQNKPDNEIMFGYNGEEYNPITDTQYLRARYYDVGMSRFISKDTYLGDTQNPLTRNLYAYTANDPVNHKDPSGNYIVDGDGNRYIKSPNSNTYKNISSPTAKKPHTSTPNKNQSSYIDQKKQAGEANTKKSKCDAEDINKLLSELVKSYNNLKELRSIGIPAASIMLAKGGRNVWSEYANETTDFKKLVKKLSGCVSQMNSTQKSKFEKYSKYVPYEKSFTKESFETFLDMLGWVPIVGDAADLLNATICGMDGDYVAAFLSAISAVDMDAIAKPIKFLLRNGSASSAAKETLMYAAEHWKSISTKATKFLKDKLGKTPAWIQQVSDTIWGKIKKYAGNESGHIGSRSFADNVLDLWKQKKDLYKSERGIDCSEIAEDFLEAAGGKGKIFHIEPKKGQIYTKEYGGIQEFYYHDVYSDGTYIYDPRFSDNRIKINDYFNQLKKLNPKGISY